MAAASPVHFPARLVTDTAFPPKPPTLHNWPVDATRAGSGGQAWVPCGLGLSSQLTASSCPTDTAGAQPCGLLPAPLPMVGSSL